MGKPQPQNISLKAYNTFGIDCRAQHFYEVTDEAGLRELCQTLQPPFFLLGGGSNMLLTKNIELPVLHIALKGIQILEASEHHALVEIAAGENWHEFVQWAIAHDLGGVENLALIPGNTGTAPVQNIGAYGVELCDVFDHCRAMEISSGKMHTFNREACEFGYRDSVFKREAKGKFIITSVVLRLTKKEHRLRTDYGAIKEELLSKGISTPGIADIAEAVISIRQSKLPDPKVLGNSGSFFKNPVIPKAQYEKLKEAHPNAPGYKVGDELIKVPAGWLIEHSGLKGYRAGDAGVHQKQALVLVNYGNATGDEILALSAKIRKEVKQNFGITIDPEVNIF